MWSDLVAPHNFEDIVEHAIDLNGSAMQAGWDSLDSDSETEFIDGAYELDSYQSGFYVSQNCRVVRNLIRMHKTLFLINYYRNRSLEKARRHKERAERRARKRKHDAIDLSLEDFGCAQPDSFLLEDSLQTASLQNDYFYDSEAPSESVESSQTY